MKKVVDKFSIQAETYRRFRPTYPESLYREILGHVSERKVCWDCATGNGQVAFELAKYFEEVYATDISQNQLNHASISSNIKYSRQRAEKTNFQASQFDLITVAQAAHWFDIRAFNKELKRVGKKNALVAIWGYGLLRINPQIDNIIDQFYQQKIGPYWNKERRHIDQNYKHLSINFEEVIPTKNHRIIVQWSLEDLRGYFASWSSVLNYAFKNSDDPIDWVIDRIHNYWSDGKPKQVDFPIFMKLGRI